MDKPTKENLGDLLVQSLTELRNGLRGAPEKLTMQTVEILNPPSFRAKAAHQLRDELGRSDGQ